MVCINFALKDVGYSFEGSLLLLYREPQTFFELRPLEPVVCASILRAFDCDSHQMGKVLAIVDLGPEHVGSDSYLTEGGV